MKMIGRDGAEVDVPDTDAQGAFQSGKFGFKPGQSIPMISRLGRPFKVDAAKAEEGFKLGAELTTEDEYKKAALQQRYGSDTAAPLLEGAARGLTGPLADYAAIKGTKALLGPEAGEKVRQHLAGEKAANPITSGVGEAGGFVGSLAIPGVGEENVAAHAPEALSLAEKIPEATKVAGALGEGGEAAEASKAAGYVPGAASTVEAPVAAAAPAVTPETAPIPPAAEKAAAASDVAEASDAQANAVAIAGGKPKDVGALGAVGQVASAVPRGITYAGKVTDQLLTHVLGKPAASTAGKIAQKVLKGAVGAGVETSLFNVSNEIDEEVLGDEELNAEKMMTAAGHGLILGGLTGGALTGILSGGGELARSVAGEASPYLRKLAGEQAVRATGMKSRNMIEAMMRRGGGEGALGGMAEVGQTALKHGVFENASSPLELLANTEKAIDEIWNGEGGLNQIYSGSKATVSYGQIEDVFDRKIANIRKTSNDTALIKHVLDQKAQTLGRLIPDVAEGVQAAHVPSTETLTAQDLAKLQEEHGAAFWNNQKKLKELGLTNTGATTLGEDLSITDLKALQKKYGPTIISSAPELEAKGFKLIGMGENALPRVRPVIPEVQRVISAGTEATLPSVAKAARETQVPIQRVIEARQAIGKEAYRSQYALDPVGYQAHMREVYDGLTGAENDAFVAAEKEMGQLRAKDIRDKRKDYQRMSMFRDALYKGSSRHMNNNPFSLIDAGTFLTGAVSGHGVLGAAGAVGRKLYRERGQAWTARYLDKLSTLGAIQRAGSQVDREIERGVANTFSPGERSLPKMKVRLYTGANASGDYDRRTAAIQGAVANADAHADHVGQIATTIADHAPKTASKFEQKALAITSFLASKIPAGHQTLNTLHPNLEKPRVTDADKAKFNRAWDMANDPVGYTFNRMNKGMLTKTDVANLQATHPKIYEQIRNQTMEAMSAQGAKMSFDKRIQLACLLNIPADPAIEPLFMQTMQKTYQDIDNTTKKAQPPKGQASPHRKIDTFSTKAALSV